MVTENKKVGVILLVLVLVLKFSIINTPHHWDTLRVDIPTAIWLNENGFNPFFGEMGWGHPPFVFEAVALAFRIFGMNQWASHLVIIIFSFLGVFFTFLLGSELFDLKTGFIASLLLLFSPMFFAQSGIVQIAVPFTALVVMTTYFLLKGDLLAYLLSASALVMTKEPGVLLIILAIVYASKRGVKSALMYGLPLAIFILWTLTNKIIFGWFLFPGSIGYLGISKLWIHLPYNLWMVFIGDFKWLVTIPIILYLKEKLNRDSLFLLSAVLTYILFFSILDVGMLPRYLLITHPFIFILGAAGLSKLRLKWMTASIAMLLIVFILSWTGNRTSECGCALETNLEYLDLIDTHLAASRFIEANYPESIVLTTWPQSDELTKPYEGYVNRQITVKIASENSDLSDVTLVYYSPQAHQPENLERIMERMNLTQLKRFEKNGKYTEVYEVYM